MRLGDLSPLLSDTAEAYYWVGFIAADGYIYDGRLRLALSDKDSNHLSKFSNFVKYAGKGITRSDVAISGLHIKHTDVVHKLCKKFDFRKAKTKNPPCRLPAAPEHLVLAYIAGFIDGDGCIQHVYGRSDCFLRIKCHRSWKAHLTRMSRVIYRISGRLHRPAKITNAGYAELDIRDNTVIRRLTIAIRRLNIPLLNRKWDKVDTERISRVEQAKIHVAKVRALLRKGFRRTDIAQKLGLCKAAITMIIQRNGLA